MDISIFNDQTLYCKELELASAIEDFLAVELDANGKLTPATTAEGFIGIARPVFGVVNGYSGITGPIAAQTDLYTKGVCVCAVSTAVTKGQRLTVDNANPGKLKPAARADKVVAVALSDDSTLARILIL